MLYKCEHCSYFTSRRRDLRRHMERRYPCYKKVKEEPCNLQDDENDNDSVEIVTPSASNVTPSASNVTPDASNVTPDASNVTLDTLDVIPDMSTLNRTCSKCKRVFSRVGVKNKHEETCNGLHSLQCAICLKVFATRQGKYKHTRYVKCSPPAQSPQVINNTTNNIHNDNSVNITNNIQINLNRANFDKISNEDIQKLVSELERNDYLTMVDNNLDIGKYVIPRTMEQIYFNDNFPKMQTLKKERRNDKMVEVHVGSGKWEKRFIDDIFRMVVSKVEQYHSQYFKHLEDKYENQDMVIGSVKWKQLTRPIKTFGNTMLWYNGFRGEDILSMGVELNYPDDDDEMEKERERRNREMEQIVGEKVYEETLAKSRRAGKAVRVG